MVFSPSTSRSSASPDRLMLPVLGSAALEPPYCRFSVMPSSSKPATLVPFRYTVAASS